MADNDIQEVTTTYSDITTLGQGYVDRVDGQQILLPLSGQVQPGEGVRYVVYLADGTPAFAGAGRCVRVNEAGDQRYETLIDTLQFDERSQPVYDYLVAVRTATYGEAAPVQSTDGASSEGDDLGMDDEETVYTGAASDAPAAEAGEGDDGLYAEDIAVADAAADDEQDDDAAAFAPDNIPRGILTRPALGLQWRTAHPHRPTGRPPGSMFQYEFGPLPMPPGPPRPDLDPSLWISRAPRPAGDAASDAGNDDASDEAVEMESLPPESVPPESLPPESLPPESSPPEALADDAEAFAADADPEAVDAEAQPSAEANAGDASDDEEAAEVNKQEDPWAE